MRFTISIHFIRFQPLKFKPILKRLKKSCNTKLQDFFFCTTPCTSLHVFWFDERVLTGKSKIASSP